MTLLGQQMTGQQAAGGGAFAVEPSMATVDLLLPPKLASCSVDLGQVSVWTGGGLRGGAVDGDRGTAAAAEARQLQCGSGPGEGVDKGWQRGLRRGAIDGNGKLAAPDYAPPLPNSIYTNSPFTPPSASTHSSRSPRSCVRCTSTRTTQAWSGSLRAPLSCGRPGARAPSSTRCGGCS